MDDVASVRSENANLRKIQQKLVQWDKLAPLTNEQLSAIDRLQELCDGPTTIVSSKHSVFN